MVQSLISNEPDAAILKSAFKRFHNTFYFHPLVKWSDKDQSKASNLSTKPIHAHFNNIFISFKLGMGLFGSFVMVKAINHLKSCSRCELFNLMFT